MYGLVHRALQCFAEDTYGTALWEKVVADAGLDFDEFESMLTYPDAMLDDVLLALSRRLDRDPPQVAEDVGAYLVTHVRMNSVRRLLRFGGATFVDFVMSLDDLHDRVKLALPDLELPRLEVAVHSQSSFAVQVCTQRKGFGPVVQGILRALADDYGALVMLEIRHVFKGEARVEEVHIEVFEAEFAAGRGFGLVVGHAPE